MPRISACTSIPAWARSCWLTLRTAHVQAMLTAIARQHAAAGCPVTVATLARIKATLRAALNAAIRAGYLADNPACRAELPAARRPRPVVWIAARVQDWEQTGNGPPVAVWLPAHTAWFLNSIQKDRLYAAYHLIALRGLRRLRIRDRYPDRARPAGTGGGAVLRYRGAPGGAVPRGRTAPVRAS